MTRQMVLMDARVRRIDAGATDVVDATSADALVRGVVVREEGLGACAFVRSCGRFVFSFRLCFVCVEQLVENAIAPRRDDGRDA